MNASTLCRTGFVAMSGLVLALPTGSFSHLAAEEIGDASAGRNLAETWCSSCHVVAQSQQGSTSTGAPTFAAVAQMKSTTPLSLRAFLLTPHARMPDLHLTRDEIDNLAAYILSLRRR
jgi:mono/diheme cytochrome c family protein